MRRFKQILPEEITLKIMKKCPTGVMGCLTEDGYPYTVPVTFAYADGKIYMHGAQEGQKVDAIKNCDKVTFSVIETDELHPEKLTTFFRSVSVFGRARIVEDPVEKEYGVRLVCDKICKYVPKEQVEEELKGLPHTGVICIDVEHMVGKEAIEFVKQRAAGELD